MSAGQMEANGKFCISCLKTVSMPGVPDFQVFESSPGSDCSKCKEQCLLEVAPTGPSPASVLAGSPRDIGVLLPEQVCGMCTWKDTVNSSMLFSAEMDPSGYYSRGFLEVDDEGLGHVSPSAVYGWETTYGPDGAEYPACAEERSGCLRSACERCIVHAETSYSNAAEKQEEPCSSLFSGGPVPDADGKLIDCGVRLVAGTHGSNIGDGINSGRVEVKHNGVWGSVCSTNWDDTDADVLCKSIGFVGGTARTAASHGCVTELATQCDPAPGPDIAKADALGVEIDPGSTRCMYCASAGQVPCVVKIVATTAQFGAEASWEVLDAAGSPIYSHSFVQDHERNSFARRLPAGQLTIRAMDSAFDGWHPQWERLAATKESTPQKNLCPLARNGVCEAALGLSGAAGCEAKTDTVDCVGYCQPFWEEHMGACRVCLGGGVKEQGTCTATAQGLAAGTDCAGVVRLTDGADCEAAGGTCTDFSGGSVARFTAADCVAQDSANVWTPDCEFTRETCGSGSCDYSDCPTACGLLEYADANGTPVDDSCIFAHDGECDDGFPRFFCAAGTDSTDCSSFSYLSDKAGEICHGRIVDGSLEESRELDSWDPEVGSIKIFSLEDAAPGTECDPSTDATLAATCAEELVQEHWVGAHAGYFDVALGTWASSIGYECGDVGPPLVPSDCAYAECACQEFQQTTCDAPFGRGRSDAKIWLGGVHCDGSESSLCACRQDPASWTWSEDGAPLQWGAGEWLTGCGSHAADAGVVCFGTQHPQPARIKDCDGVCVPASRWGDGWCDSGEFLADFNCKQMECDKGDCSVGCAPAPVACPAGQWSCENGACIDGSKRCDAFPDCADKSDEMQCEGVFCCTDGSKCIPEGWVSDGWPDCLDASDEPGGNYDKYVFNLNNLYCRSVLPMCDMYLQERHLSCSDTILPNDGCSPVPGTDEHGALLRSQWNDGVCQPVCGTERCGYDGGDCPVGLDMLACDRRMEETECSGRTSAACAEISQCIWRVDAASPSGSCQDNPDGFYHDGVCDLRFNTTECGFDNGECLKCSWEADGRDCDSDFLGDGFCDWDCHVPGCNWDEGDCPAVDASVCPVEYGASQLADGRCDSSFNTEACGCDGGDCTQEDANGNKRIGSKTFLCAGDGQTIFREQVCDGSPDCARGEDEERCHAETVCTGVYLYLETVEFGNEVQFSVDGGPRYGDKSLGAPWGNEIVSRENQNIAIALTPGPHTITLYDLGGDGWGVGAHLDVMYSSGGGTPVLVAGTGSPYFSTYLSGVWSEHEMHFDVGTCAGSTTSTGTAVKMTCHDGSTIPSSKVCDGMDDCPSGEDELTGCTFTCGPPNCEPLCPSHMLGNGFCDSECFTASCGYDLRDCDGCKEGCFDWLIGDGVCNSECANTACLLDGTVDYLGVVTSDCSAADLPWAAAVAQQTLASLQTVRSELSLSVAPSYAAALADTSGAPYIQLKGQLKAGIAAVTSVLESDVTIYSITVVSGRRQAQASTLRQLQAGSVIAVSFDIESDPTLADKLQLALAPGSGAHDMLTALGIEIINRAMASAAATGFRDAIVSTAEDVVASIPEPTVAAKEDGWQDSIVCAPAQATAAEATAPWQALDCLFSQTMDGNCDCQCLSSFEGSDPSCFANDEASGDCDAAGIIGCLGSDPATLCAAKFDRFSCEAAGCGWNSVGATCAPAGACDGGLTLTDRDGVIVFPETHSNGNHATYESNSNCRWIVECATDAVSVSFSSLSVEAAFDFVWLEDRTDPPAPFDAGKLSGSTAPAAIVDAPISGAFVVRFRSDGSGVAGGFSLIYNCTGNPARLPGETGPPPEQLTCANTDLATDTPVPFDCTSSGSNISDTASSIACAADPCTAEECCTVVTATCADTNGNLDGATSYDCTTSYNSISGRASSITCASIGCTADECCTVLTPVSSVTGTCAISCGAQGCTQAAAFTCADIRPGAGGPIAFDCSLDANDISYTPAAIICAAENCTAAECCTVAVPTCARWAPLCLSCPGHQSSFDCSSHANSLAADPGAVRCAEAQCTAEECCTVVPSGRRMQLEAERTAPDHARRHLQSAALSPAQDGSACTGCTVVAGSISVTCDSAFNSRAVCAPGYTHVDNAADRVSDTCTIKPSNCASNYNNDGVTGAFPASACTAAGMTLKSPLPESSCAAEVCSTTDCCELPCTPVANADSVACSTIGNSRVAACSAGYFKTDNSAAGTSDACTPCTPVTGAASITCVAAGNSRAVCAMGFTRTDNSAASASDVCTQDPKNCATNWNGAGGGAFPASLCAVGWSPFAGSPCAGPTCGWLDCCEATTCAHDPCGAGGNCTAGGSGFSCTCADGSFPVTTAVPGVGSQGSCSACSPVANAAAVTCTTAGDSQPLACDPGYALVSGACVAIVCASGCPATVSNCVHRPSASSDFACACAPGYYSRLALQPAPRQIPSGWSEGSAPTPVPAPARVTVHVASPAPVPIVFVNTTEPAPPPPPAPNLLGGFTPSCRDLAVDIKTQSDLCDPDDVVFQYFMPITQEAQVDAMKTGFNEQLVQQLWIDSQSKDVEVQFVIYNGNLQLFAVTTVVFEFDKAGGVSSTVVVTALDLESNGRYQLDNVFVYPGVLWNLLELAVVLYVVTNGFGELGDLWEAHKFHGSAWAYFHSIWNYFDLGQIAVFSFCGFYWFLLLDVMDRIKISQRFDWSDSTGSTSEEQEAFWESSAGALLQADCADLEIERSSCTPQALLLEVIENIQTADGYFRTYKTATVGNLFLTLVRVFKFARFQPQLSMVNRTLTHAKDGLVHFLLLFIVVGWVMAAQLKLLYGRQLVTASTWGESLNLFFLMCLGAFPDETADVGANDWLATLWFYVFFILVFFVLVNFFLAIVMDAYEDAKEEIDGENSVVEDIEQWWSNRLHSKHHRKHVRKARKNAGRLTGCRALLSHFGIGAGQKPQTHHSSAHQMPLHEPVCVDDNVDIALIEELGLIDGIRALAHPKVRKLYEAQHQKTDPLGIKEPISLEKMTNNQFIDLMNLVKQQGRNAGNKGVLSHFRFVYTDADVQELVTWYHAYVVPDGEDEDGEGDGDDGEDEEEEESGEEGDDEEQEEEEEPGDADDEQQDDTGSQDGEGSPGGSELAAYLADEHGAKVDAMQAEVADIREKMDAILAALGTSQAGSSTSALHPRLRPDEFMSTMLDGSGKFKPKAEDGAQQQRADFGKGLARHSSIRGSQALDAGSQRLGNFSSAHAHGLASP